MPVPEGPRCSNAPGLPPRPELLELPERVQEVAVVPDKRAVQEVASARLHPAPQHGFSPARRSTSRRMSGRCAAGPGDRCGTWPRGGAPATYSRVQVETAAPG